MYCKLQMQKNYLNENYFDYLKDYDLNIYHYKFFIIKDVLLETYILLHTENI